MLKLKRVEIQGFKSFYERTEMKFNGSGIAAVVGPNGCGKSNLSDAISWVLGEQSAKSLRGSRMEDVIFAGTREKKPLSMASVTMTLVPGEGALLAAPVAAIVSPSDSIPSATSDDTEPAVEPGCNAAEPADAAEPESSHGARTTQSEVVKAAERQGEITITRRLYRSGDSDYLINGKGARLRDIQDLFLGTGLGPESYAIIEQGRIGQILSNKPQDRRNVIEEAAGITKFKNRKRLAEARLESAKQNLSRVFDILEEVNRQVNSLKRQAAKTKRYGELKTEALSYLRLVLAAKFKLLERETAKLAIELNLASAELEKTQGNTDERERDQKAIQETLYATELELTESREKLSDLRLEAERARGKVEYQAKQIQQIEFRLSAAAQEEEAAVRQQAERAAELDRHGATLATVETGLIDARDRLAIKSAHRQQAQSKLAEQEHGLEASRQRVLKLLSESSGLKNRITHLEAQLATTERDTARALAEEQQADSDRTRVEQVKKQLSERLRARQTELISVTDQRRELDGQLGEGRSKLGEARQTLDRLQSEFSRVKARRDSLEEVIQHRSYTTETVKRLFTAVERGKTQDLKPVGVLADFLEVDPQYEKATEEFLHEELEYVVVRDWAEADRGIELMRGELNGRATFLVEASEEGASQTSQFPAPNTEPGKLTKLTDTLRFTNGLTHIPLDGLERITNCYVATDRELAQRLAAEFPHCWFLAADGVSCHGQLVSGGKKTGAGPLALKRELREVGQLETIKGAELAAARTSLTELEKTIARWNEQLEYLRGQQQAQEKDVLALDHEDRKLAEEFQRIQTRLSNARLELDRISRDQVKLRESINGDRAALERSELARAEQEAALEFAREELHGLQGEVAHAGEEHATLRADLASLEERQRSGLANRTQLENQLRDLVNRQSQLQQEAERLATERVQLSGSNDDLEAKRGEVSEAIAAGDRGTAEMSGKEAGFRGQLAELEEQLKALRAQGHGIQERRSELQVSLARGESDLKHLEATCQQECETTLSQLSEGVEEIPDASAIEEMEANYGEVRRKIDSLGPVNPQALQEFEEASERQEFLNVQRQDLLDSIRDTETAIHEIDSESRKRFSEAFGAINANFREMFTTLFGGGSAEMRLNDEENVSESGIDIVASPPGKRLQSVLLLSGGEKSLTAMALLMGIFQYTPSPFCVLDEVDAPLDEPNIERLTRLIREMAEQTQFIVITHSKRTMEAAQSLYGVTMQEPGISKLVSVKFKEFAPERSQTPEQPAQEKHLEAATV